MKSLLYAYLILHLGYLGYGQVPLTKLHTIEEMAQLSETLVKVSGKAKAATVCIDLGGGASGSGVLISESGLILSAAHVTQAVGQEFEVIFEDGTRYPAVGLGLNTTSDASMAKIIPDEGNPSFPFVPYSTDIAMRQYVFSLGHSGGFDKERGIVMRLGRITEIGSDSIKSDCTLIGGDSGGPLFDLSGNLIGIHSRVGTITSSNTHIPIADFKKHWNELEEGKVWGDGTFANAGFLVQGMRLMDSQKSLEVIDVKEGSNAQKAGVLPGDILLSINGQEVKTLKEVLGVLADSATYQKALSDGLPLKVSRDDEQKSLTLSIDE